MTDSLHWLLHLLYVRKEFDECFKLMNSFPNSEYSLFVKGLITRQKGQLNDSLQYFQSAATMNPTNPFNLKQIGKTLFLLGKLQEALEVYEEARKIVPNDWEIFHHKATIYMQLKKYDLAEEHFIKANSIQKHDVTFLQLGKLYTMQDKLLEAIEIYLEALDFSPENPELLCTIGLLYLRMGDSFKAFDYLGNSLTHDSKNSKTILAAGSIMQDHLEMDVALMKYRIAAVQNPNSAQLWNNIGLCFLGKNNTVAAIVCLKRALFLSPFEWIIAFNLGLTYLHAEQYCSAFHFLNVTINLKDDYAHSYMYLAIALNKLDDFENCCQAFEKAIELDGNDYLILFNYCIILVNHGNRDLAQAYWLKFESLYQVETEKKYDVEVNELREAMHEL